VRLAARETSTSGQNSPYPPSPPYISQQLNDFPPPQPSQESYPPQQEQSPNPVSTVNSGPSTGAPSTKRPLPEPEAAPAPKAKRAKDKFKVTTSGTQEVSTTSTGQLFSFRIIRLFCSVIYFTLAFTPFSLSQPIASGSASAVTECQRKQTSFLILAFRAFALVSYLVSSAALMRCLTVDCPQVLLDEDTTPRNVKKLHLSQHRTVSHQF